MLKLFMISSLFLLLSGCMTPMDLESHIPPAVNSSLVISQQPVDSSFLSKIPEPYESNAVRAHFNIAFQSQLQQMLEIKYPNKTEKPHFHVSVTLESLSVDQDFTRTNTEFLIGGATLLVHGDLTFTLEVKNQEKSIYKELITIPVQKSGKIGTTGLLAGQPHNPHEHLNVKKVALEEAIHNSLIQVSRVLDANIK
jgi:hypothetical protein